MDAAGNTLDVWYPELKLGEAPEEVARPNHNFDNQTFYTRVLRMATWGCLRNYLLVFGKKREGFCGMKNRISPI